MKKNNFYYSKRAFSLSLPIAVFFIVRDLFDVDLSDGSVILNIVIKGIAAGMITGIILGLINILCKKDSLIKNKKD